MANRPSRIVISIQTASYDGKFYGRYAHGEKPVSGAVLAADAAVRSAVSAALSTGIRLAGTAQGSSQETAGLSTAIRLAGSASDVVSGGAAFSDDDWIARSAGAFFANRLDTQAAIDTYGFQDGFQPRLPVLDVSLKPSGAAGSAKIVIANTDGSSCGALKIPFGQSFTAGQTVWTSYRLRVPPECAYMHWPTADETGLKSSIISNTLQSNMDHELVVQDTDMGARVQGYYQDGNVTAVHTNRAIVTSANASDFSQPADIDRSARANSAAFTTYPLNGTNPDTGDAWSTWEQERARFGLLYSAMGSPGAPDYKRGLGDPISGAARLWPGEFITITQRVIVGQYGQANNRWTCWAARDGKPYVLCWDLKNILLGSDGLTNPYNCLWLPTGYVSSRQAGGRNISSRSSNITGVTIYATGNATPIGAGTLEYNATTQRFRWSGFGESFGTARGFSVASGKTRLNVISANVNSWLVIEVTAASLPASGTVTDSVTIANGRPDTQVNLADVIFHTQPILGPGGYTPVDIDGTAFEQAVAGSATNSFATFTITNQINTDPSGTTDGFLSYSPKLSWDPIYRRLNHFGGNHGSAGTFQRLWLSQYYADSNAWNPAPIPIAVPGGNSSQVTHGFCGGTIDTQTGDFYCIDPYIDLLVVHRYRPSTGTWDTPLPNFTAPDVDRQSCAALEYHKSLYGGQGGLVYGNANGLWTINLRSPTAWTRILDRSNQVDAMAYGGFGVSAYCRKDDCVYMGGGDNSNFPGEVPLWKIPASAGAGTPSQIASSPGLMSSSNDSSDVGFVCDSGKISNGLKYIQRSGLVYEFNAAGNSWNPLGNILPAAIVNATNRWMAFGSIPDEAIVAITAGSDKKTSTTLHFWNN